jgi:hypothetical protein
VFVPIPVTGLFLCSFLSPRRNQASRSLFAIDFAEMMCGLFLTLFLGAAFFGHGAHLGMMLRTGVSRYLRDLHAQLSA